MMRLHLLALGLVAVRAAAVRADREIGWPAKDKLPKNVTLHAAGNIAQPAVIEVKGLDDKAIQILEINEPKVPGHRYMLKGKVKYAGVDKDAYLEMWSHFPDTMAYFTRTLADQGPLAKIQGDSDWREIALPFTAKEDYLPEKLIVNVVLPGQGTIYLTPLTLTKIPNEN
jgi:hypothetical protein